MQSRPRWSAAAVLGRVALSLAVLTLAACTPVAAGSDRAGSDRATLGPSGVPAPAAHDAVVGSAPAFHASVSPLPAAVVAEMTGRSWRPGCPVALSRLRLVQIDHWGFDGTVHRGELVVHADLAERIVRIFGRLFDARFPVRRMQRVDVYAGSDHASMSDDNTSMFNCRRAEGSTSWSRHAYGTAIDLNPLENPYLRGGTVLPPAGAAYLDRTHPRPGMVIDGDVVVRAFEAEGFGWGGRFRSLVDYQHFEVLT